MLLLLYIFQVLLLPQFYEIMKTNEIYQTVALIKNNWQSDDVVALVDELAMRRKMYIEISFPDNPYLSYSANESGSGTTFIQITKESYKKELIESETGVKYWRYRDERERNNVLLIGTYVGASNNVEAFIFASTYLQPVGTTVSILQSQFTIVALSVLVFTFVVSIFFANRISNPIIRINKAAKQLPQGKFDSRIIKSDFTEISQLSETLTAASKEIAKSDDLRKELMANISHDLRTPLTMIKAYAEMIRDLSGDNPEKREKHLKVIIDETDRLSSLVTDILDLSKLQSGVIELNLVSLNFSQHLSNVISRFAILKDNEGYNVVLDAEDGVYITADITKLEQVVYNLVNNAVTYTGEDKTVNVKLFRIAGGKVRFEVRDSGDGIAPEFLPYIWDRYYKVSERSKTHQRAKMGSGLGLSIVKTILETHKFAYGADSTVGKGSVFWFEAPLDTVADGEQRKTL